MAGSGEGRRVCVCVWEVGSREVKRQHIGGQREEGGRGRGTGAQGTGGMLCVGNSEVGRRWGRRGERG